MNAEHFRTPPDGGPSGEIGKMLHSVYESGKAAVAFTKIIITSIPEELHLRTPEKL